MTLMLRPILVLAFALTAQQAHAEEGFLDTLFGGSSRSTPPNPFASNYPSAPPTRDDVQSERQRRPVRTERGRGMVPPGRIPEE